MQSAKDAAMRPAPPWAELLQLVPIVSLAFPFILQGTVDLQRARLGFVIAAALTVPITALVVARRHPPNPILIGAGLWLWLGAVAFGVPIAPMASWVAETQAVGLFVGALLVGTIATFVSPHGYIACVSSDPRWTRRASWLLVAFTIATIGWSWIFRHDVRLGAGLPFIVLTVTRRVLGRFAPRVD